MPTVKVGQRIRRLRISLEVTQERLAEMASISRDALARIERDERSPRLPTLAALASALGVRVEELWVPDVTAVSAADAFRVRRVAAALSRVSPSYADRVIGALELLCMEPKVRIAKDARRPGSRQGK